MINLDENFEDKERECWYFGAGGDLEDFVSDLVEDWAAVIYLGDYGKRSIALVKPQHKLLHHQV